ncbi:MAG: cupin domain-containing protein, partial [Gammaproteobacteria bacterium]|nr:cupin domain-containing protein [Gammaproteobacteria bacterium]
MFGLANIIKPLCIEDFLMEYAGNNAVFIPGETNKFENLYEWGDVNHIVNNSRPSFESVRLVYEKQTLPNQELANIGGWLERGATLVINHTQHIDPINEQFAEALANDVNASVNINCYVSFPTKQGFDCHYDTHDVFVINTAGIKSWKVFHPTRKFPLDRDPASDKKLLPLAEDAKPYLECTLTPGDVLYIPRGHWHYAISEEACIHLTVSHSNRSCVDYLVWLINEMRKNDEFLREDFPLYRVESLLGDRPDDELKEHLEKFRQHLTEFLKRDSFLESILHWVQFENPIRRKYQLPELAEISQNPITPETRFYIAPNQKLIPRHDPNTGRIEIISRGGLILFERVPKSMIELILDSKTPFCGKDLQQLDSDVS